MSERSHHRSRKWKKEKVELSIMSELERSMDVKGKVCRKLKRKYKLNKESITTVKETVKQRMNFTLVRIGFALLPVFPL